MRKALMCIQKSTLLEDLKNIPNQDVLHLIRILFDMKIAAKCGNYKSQFFNVDTGRPQGDCGSASEFTFYLAKSLETTIANDTTFFRGTQ